ncbi:MAG: hypothetical protein ABW049_09605 [Spongiibacteraceae bacterium]
METPDSKDTADTSVAGVSADNSESPPNSGTSETSSATTTARPSAIERQAAAASGYGNQTHQENPERAYGQHEAHARTDRRQPGRWGLVSFLVLFFLVAGGALLVFTDQDRSLQKIVDPILATVAQITAAPEDTSQTNNPSPATNPSPVINSLPSKTPPPAVAPLTAAPNQVAIAAPAEAIAVPVGDISLRKRPELLEQLVQVYRSKLAEDSTDSAALAALNRLEEQSLSELETIIAEGNNAVAVRSLEIIAQVFPEIADTARYKYLAAQTTHEQREAATEPAAKPEPATSSTAATSTPAAAPPMISPPTSVSIPFEPAAKIAANHTDNVALSKPKVRVVSITPGAMMEGRFVPGNDGKVFMVTISYRNFSNAEDQSETTLVARLGAAGNPTALAEVPVELSGDRGTKSFLMETFTPGNIGEKYRLNFLLNDEFLASSTVRLSIPEQ